MDEATTTTAAAARPDDGTAPAVDQQSFESLVTEAGGAAEATKAGQALRAGQPTAPFEVAALAMSVAAVRPEGLVDVYDALTGAWTGQAPAAAPITASGDPDALEADFLEALWALVWDPDVGRDPADI